MDNITQSQNHKRNVSRINYNDVEILWTKSTPLGNEFLKSKLSKDSKKVFKDTQASSKRFSNNETTSTQKPTQSYRRIESQLNEDFLSKKKQIQALKLLRENSHSVKKDMNSYYKDKTFNFDELTTDTADQDQKPHHITVKKSLDIEKEFPLAQFHSTEQSIPNFNIGTDYENLAPSTQNAKTMSSHKSIVLVRTTVPSALQFDPEQTENKLINKSDIRSTITTPSSLVLMPTPHIHSNVMKTNFLTRPSPARKNDQPMRQNGSSELINETNHTKYAINSNQLTISNESVKPKNRKVPKVSVPVEEKIEDTVFYTDIVDPEDQFDKKNEIYKNNYLDQSEYQAILDKFFNGKKQNRKMKVPKNILSIDKLLEQNTKKPMYLSNSNPAQSMNISSEITNETNTVQGNQDASVKSSDHVKNSSTERIPETIILKDLDNMSAAQDTNPFIHWDDINENQQLDSYRRKNQDWFILQLTGKFNM